MVWNIFKVYNKNTRTYFTPFSSVFIIDVEQIILYWDKINKIFFNFHLIYFNLFWLDTEQHGTHWLGKIKICYILYFEWNNGQCVYPKCHFVFLTNWEANFKNLWLSFVFYHSFKYLLTIFIFNRFLLWIFNALINFSFS